MVGYSVFTPSINKFGGLLFLILGSFMFEIGEMTGYKLVKKVNKANIGEQTSIGNLSWILLAVFIALAFTKNLISINKHGFDLSYFYDIRKFLEMNTTMAYERYYGNESASIVESILLSFVYLACLFGGFLFPYAKTRASKVFCFFALLPPLITVLFQNTKLVFLDSLFLYFVGYAICNMLESKNAIRINYKTIKKIVIIVVFVGAIFFISMCAKIGGFDSKTINIVRKRIVDYAFGSLESFALWFSRYNRAGTDYGFGINTFMAPFDLLGIVKRSQGVYDFINGAASNIFTGYRALIQDYGRIIGIVIVFATGVLSGVIYYKLKNGNKSKFILTLYGCVMFTVLHYWLGSPWVYSSLWLTFIMFYFSLYSLRISIVLGKK